jgi:hypothetical protein
MMGTPRAHFHHDDCDGNASGIEKWEILVRLSQRKSDLWTIVQLVQSRAKLINLKISKKTKKNLSHQKSTCDKGKNENELMRP